MSKSCQATLEPASDPVANPAAASVLDRPGITQSENEEPASESFTHETRLALGRPGPDPPPDGSQQNVGHTDFARLEVHGSSALIRDDDAARALVTRWLLSELAPLLGLDPERIEIRVNSESEHRANARGASGLMEGGTIYLHPELYKPERETGRYLLAHEATHVAQLAAPAGPLISSGEAVADAEREADEFARAFVKRIPIRAPRRRVPAGRAMAKEAADSDGPSHEALVAQNRTAELAEIQDRLSYGVFDWVISDDDITAILRELESLDFLTITAIAKLLTPKQRKRFAHNLDEIHFAAFRPTILAFHLGIAHKNEIDSLPDNPFPGITWTGLSEAEHYAAYEILTAFLAISRGREWHLRRTQKEYYQVQDILTNKPRYDVDKEREKARKKEEKVATERKEAEEALKAEDVDDFIKQAKKKLSYGIVDWAVRDHEVLAVLDGMSDFASEPPKLRAIVTSLEREGLMDRLMNNMPVDALYSDVGAKTGGGRINRRRIFLQVAAMRPPAKLTALAEDLLSRGLFDWAITDEDAYLAQQLLKAVSPRARESFLALKGGKFAGRLDSELSLSMKKGREANFYQGGEEGRDLQKLKAQLADDTLWSLEQINRLGMLIQMALAAGEGDWVFAQSKDRYELYETFQKLYEDKEFFGRIIERFGLYKPKGLKRPDGTIDTGREQYAGEQLKGKPFGTDNAFWTYVIQGLDFIFESGNVEIMGESIGGERLDFGEFQDVTGGSFLGAEFKREEQVSDDKKRKELSDNSVRWDLDQGVLQLRASRLEIANIHYPMANLKFQSGSGTVTGLHLHLQYPTEESQHHSTTLQLRVDSLLLNDVLLIFTDSMVGLQSVLVEGLTIELRPENVREAFASPHGGAAVAIPILAPVISPVVNIIKLSGSIDEMVKGLVEPESIEDLTVTSQNLVLKGLTTSGGQYVEDISLGPLNLRTRYARSLDFYIKGLQEEKKRLEGRLTAVRAAAAKRGPKPRYYLELDTEPSLQLQIESIDRELVYIAEAQAERVRLTDLRDAGKISPADEHKLWKVSTYLDGLAKGGVALDVASAKISGLAGKVSAKEVSVDAIHGYGQSAGASLGFLFSSTTMNRMLRGRDYRGTVQGIDEEGEPQFFLETNNITIKELALEASVPTIEEAEKALKKAEALLEKTPNDASLIVKRDRALVLRNAAVTYWTLLEKPGGMLLGAERDKLTKAREELTKERAFFAQLLTLDEVTLELGQGAKGGERIGLSAGAIHGETLEAGGVTIGAIDGKNVMIGAGSRGGLSALMKDWRKELKTGQFAADSLIATDIKQASSGATVDRVALTNAGASLEVDGSGKIDLKAATVEVTGVSIVATRQLLEAEKRFLLMVPKEARHEADDKKITAIEESIKELDAYEDMERLCQAALDEARKTGTPKDVAEAEESLKFATFAKTEWQRRLVLRGLSIDQLNISVLGLGNVLDEDFDLDAAIADGVSVEGKGEGGRWFNSARLKDSRIPGLRGDEVVLGPTGGKLSHSEQETVLEDFFIESVAATGLEFHAPPNHISSRGTSTLTNLRGSATFIREKRPDKKGFETWQLATIKVPSFKIDKIEAQDLSYAYSTLDDFYTIEIESGSIGNVWVDNLQVDFTPDDQVELHGIDPDKPGGAGIDQVNNVKLVGFFGEKIKAGGLLNGRGIKAEFIEAKKQRFTIDEITATKGTFTKQGVADLGFTVRKLGLAVTREITDTGDVFDIEKIKVPSVSLHTGCTFTKGSMTVELLGSAELTGILLSGKVTRTKQGDKMKVTSAVVKDIVIPDITASKIHVTVAGKPADPAKGTKATPPIDVMVPNASIKGLHAWGFDVLNFSKGSFETTSASVTDVAVEIAKRGEAEFKKIGVTVTSEGLAGTLMGPDRIFLDLGKTDLSGSYEGGGVEVKKFSVKGIGGFVDIGPDYVRVFDLNTGPLKVGPVVYKDADGNRMDLDSVDCPAVHLKDLHAKWVKDPTTKEDKFAELTFTGLKFDKIDALGFKYRGRFTSENAKKEKVVSKLELDATSATLEPLVIDDFTYDALKELVNIEPNFDKLNITGFQAKFQEWADGKMVQKLKLATDVTGKNMKANLNFKHITSATGDAWKFSHGTFHIDEFGLKHPDIEYSFMDDKGELQEWTVKNIPSKTSAFDLSGLDVTVMPDGTMFVDFDALAASNVRVKQKDGPTINVELAKLKTAAIAMQNQTPDKAFELLGATFDELELQGVKVEIEVDRNAPSTGGGPPKDLWALDALDSLNGGLRLYFTDAKYYLDADVNVPISNGVIDFNQVDLEHLGPNTMMGISTSGIYIDPVGTIMLRKYLYERRNIQGATFEVIIESEPMGPDDTYSYHIPDRGSLNLKGFFEQMLNDPLAGTGEAPKQLEDLNRMNLRGTLSIGDDPLGTSKNGVTLSGKSVGKNVIKINGANLGENLRIEIPEFQASKGKFEAMGKAGETGQINAKIKMDFTGLGSGPNAAGHLVFTITMEIDNGTVKAIKWGDVGIVSTVQKAAEEQTKAAKEAKEAKAKAAEAAATAK